MSKREKIEAEEREAAGRALVRSHLRFGWWSLLVFLTLGVVLEALHGFKVGWYLGSEGTTRRLMWTLAHAHGVLLALVHIAFAATRNISSGTEASDGKTASALLKAAGILLPGGFFLGGLWIYGGDPGLGILLVPIGALCLFISVLLTVRGIEKPT